MEKRFRELADVANNIISTQKINSILLIDIDQSDCNKLLNNKINIDEKTTDNLEISKKHYDLIIINDIYGDYIQNQIDKIITSSEKILVFKSNNKLEETKLFYLNECLKKFSSYDFFINHKFDLSDSSKRILCFTKKTDLKETLIENEINLFVNSAKDTYRETEATEELDKANIKINKQQEKIQNKDQEISEKNNTIKFLENTIHNERFTNNILHTDIKNMTDSASWKITKPIRVSSKVLRKFFGMNIYKKKFKQFNGNIDTTIIAPPNDSTKSVDSLINELVGHPTEQIQTLFLPSVNERRLNIVIDSLNKNSLLGGVATALVVATEFAKKQNLTLRIITRNENINPIDYNNIMNILDIKVPNKIEYFSDYNRKNEENSKKLEIGNNDIFMATSWWSAKAIKKTSLKKRFYYIIQEIETYFYPHGDNHLEVQKIMNDQNIDFIVNSKYLWDYFIENEPNITTHGVYFNPVFSKKLYFPGKKSEKSKKTLFFYARIQNPRNLFCTGIKLLDEAIKRGIINTNEWNICFAGQNTPEFKFCDDSKPHQLGLMDWKEYSEFLKTVDVAISLMYTPHPSYPPFDVAASGGVVLSNTCKNKRKFIESENVILSELDMESLMKNLEKSVKLSLNTKQRQINFENNKICTSWSESLEETLKFMENKYNA